MSSLEAIYAEALLDLAQTPEESEQFGNALQAYADAYAENTQLRTFLQNPTLPRRAQKDVLDKLAPNGTPMPVVNCLRVMVDKGRIGLLPQMAAAFRAQRATKIGVPLIKVYSAIDLSDEDAEHLRRNLMTRLDLADAELDIDVNPALIGGMRIQVGDMVYDHSLFGRIEGLRRAIEERLHK